MGKAGRLGRQVAVLALLAVAGLGIATAGLRAADDLSPLDLSRLDATGAVVTAADGRVLRLFPSEDGILRLPVRPQDLAEIDPGYRALLLAVEDKRFRRHDGVDPLAVARAALTALASGRVRSGASTITMQLARLLDPKPRTLAAKLEEMFRAWQLERRFGKDEILAMYLTLAPYGGRVEGVRAAALTWFGKEPRALTPGETGLLVALPQAPARLRPDRAPEAAAAARAAILARGTAAGVLAADVAARAALEPLPGAQRAIAVHAPHLARDLASRDAGQAGSGGWQRAPLATTLDADLQAQVEAILAARAPAFGAAAGIAALVVDNRSRRVLAYAGNADFLDEDRAGHVDMVTATRSPGSTLKPVIYAMAFDAGLAHPETYVRDAPASFGGYRPRNFASEYHGDITLREALQLSLNVPAVRLMERLGPPAFVSRLRRAGTALALPDDAAPGLAVALGGVGINLRDLTGLYAALADDGRVRPLRTVPGEGRPAADEAPLFGAPARWHVGRILADAGRPADRVAAGYASRGIAFKTGTSYGFRDAWAVGFDRDHTVGVWLGRADGTPLAGITGLSAAAPILFRIFDLLPAGAAPPGPVPPGTLVAGHADLPPPLQRLDGGAAQLAALRFDDGAPRITFPPDTAELDLRDLAGGLPLQAEGGTRPLRWLVDGRPLPSPTLSRQAMLSPDGPGFLDIAVVDAQGRRDGVALRLRRAGPDRAPASVLTPAAPRKEALRAVAPQASP
ncbi:penicillin-binding protein 1C [Marinibaculum pumilum]|uniref:peptidoglycan glycosyltransferase n=1 Tax=Marinibaculum pumilum TaxID=1766165 RepID=A0ABV7L915_9PROT